MYLEKMFNLTLLLVFQIILFFRCSASGTTLSECTERYSKLDFFNTTDNPGEIDKASDNGIPPLLLSYPGAGNTFVRSLIEYTTGINSCSVYLNDKELSDVFKGEKLCDRKCSVIKGHPSDFFINVEVDIHNRPAKRGDKREKLRINNKFMRKKCGRGLVQFFSSAIILVRDPYESILSDFQRIITNSHRGTVNIANNQSYSNRNSRRYPLAKKNITNMWLKTLIEKRKEFNSSMSTVISPIMLSNFNYPHISNKNSSDSNLDLSYTIVRFEDLIRNSTRIDALRSLLMKAFPASRRTNVTTERLECAFVLTENREGIQRKKKYMNLQEMYNEIDPTIPCQLSPYVGSFAEKFSYPLYPAGAVTSLCPT